MRSALTLISVTHWSISVSLAHRALQAVIALVLHGLWSLDYAIEDARQSIRRARK